MTAQKGQAGVSVPTFDPPSPPEPKLVATELPAVQLPSASTKMDETPKLLATKSMTVKIDEVSYKKLKTHGLNIGKTSQDIFVEALAMYFKANKI